MILPIRGPATTDIAANRTADLNDPDVTGHFSIPIKAGYFTTDGPKTIGVQATDAAGEKGNIQPLTFI